MNVCRGVQQRAGGVLERDGALGEQPLDRALARERRPRAAGPLGRELLVESDDARRCRVLVAHRAATALASDAIPHQSAGSRRPTR